MARRSRPLGSTELAEPYLDVSRGIVGGISDSGVRPNWVRAADNIEFDPIRGWGVRRGSRDINGATLPAPGHSIMAYYSAAGVPTFFIGAGDKLYRVNNTSYTEQTLPYAPVSGAWWVEDNINGILVAVPRGGANPPIFYDGTNWLSSQFPTPAAPTGAMTVAAGNVDLGVHLYRIHFLFKNGNSLASNTLSMNVAGVNKQVDLTLPAAPAGRTDFTGYWIERTRTGQTGPYYFVAIVNTPTTAYSDLASDATLTSRIPAQPGPSALAPNMDGLVAWRDRIVGWKGSTIYVSEPIGGFFGAGILNFHPLNAYPVKADDGDQIQIALNTTGDRLILVKANSGHALDGTGPEDLRITELWRNAGAANPRAATVFDGEVVMYSGQGRVFKASTRGPQPFGKVEVGHYLKTIPAAGDATVVLHNHRGTHLMLAYTETPAPYNEHVLVYRSDLRNWTHWKGWRIADCLSPPRPALAGGVEFVFADPKLIEGGSQASGGTAPSFISWSDRRSSFAQRYVQRVNSAGIVAWTANGVAASQAAAGSTVQDDKVAVLPLADGGCILAFVDNRGAGNMLWAQKYSATGAELWAAGGVVILNIAASPDNIAICEDGGGGAIIAWTAILAADGTGRIAAQRVDATGAVQWVANGKPISTGAPGTSTNTGAGSQDSEPILWPDGSGGAYVAWRTVIPTLLNRQVRANRINASGDRQWGTVNNPINLGYMGRTRAITRDPTGGLFVALGNSSDTVITLAKLSTTGAVLWTSANMDTSVAAVDRFSICTVPDGLGGAYVCYVENGASDQMRIRRVDSTGAIQWGAPVVLHTYGAGRQATLQAGAADGSGAAIICWTDEPNDLPSAAYAAKIALDGSQPWGSNVTVMDHADALIGLQAITDGSGGVIIFTHDGLTGDIYARRVQANGTAIWDPAGIVVCNATGAQASGMRTAAFTGAYEGQFPQSSLTGYRAWVGFTGFRDEAAADGTGGLKIPTLIQYPDIDDGQPDVTKDFSRLEFYVRKGSSTINATIQLDVGRIVGLAVSSSRSTAKWGKTGVARKIDTLIWAPRPAVPIAPDNPRKWGGQRIQDVKTALPDGTVGKRYSLTLKLDLEAEFICEGFTLDWRPLPERKP